MTPRDIRTYRPQSWMEFVGKANHAGIRRLQQAACTGQLPPPLLVIAPYGMGKTSLARHLQKAFGCARRDHRTGDPCSACDDCQRIGPQFNGEGLIFPRWEIDCTRITSQEQIVDLFASVEQGDRASIFFDEFHRLSRRSVAEPLLKFTEEFPRHFEGLLVLAIVDKELALMPAPLFERLRKVWLTSPTQDEMVAALQSICARAGLSATDALVRQLVLRSQQSFRTCLDILAAALEQGTALNEATMDEFLPSDPDNRDGGAQFDD